jgi:hypothetical protein
MRQYAAVPVRTRRQSRLLVAAWVLALLAIVAALAALVYVTLRWLVLQAS